nr:RNA polymerase subunit sigma [uncultured Fluviicola sp.]
MDDLIISEEIKNSSSVELMEYIALKSDFPTEAKEAFEVFCYRFGKELKEKAEIICNNWNYNEVVALDIVNCTFNRVWKYASFNSSKAKGTDMDKAIRVWLFRIAQSQLANHHNNSTCYDLTQEEDLSIISSVDELAEHIGTDVEKKKELRKALDFLNDALSTLTDKHKVIFLTYKAYEKNGKRIVPHAVAAKLRANLGLVQSTVKVYKNQAYELVENYIKQNHGKIR